MTCRELAEFLDRYLGGELAAAEAAEFDRHLTICPDCVAYLQTYRETVRLGKAAFAAGGGPPAAIPPDLVAAILAARGKRA